MIKDNTNLMISLERSLRKYYMVYYKDFVFKRDTLDKKITKDKITFYLKVPDKLIKLYGEFTISINSSGKIIDIQPEKHLREGYMRQLEVYKGMYYSEEKDKFKIDLLGVM